MTTRQHYTPQQRAEAVGLALTVGARAAGRQTGIPFGLIARWSKRPDLAPVLLESRQQVADKLWLTIQEGTSAVLEGLRDSKQRLGDRASALRVAIEAHALLTGGATSRSDNRNVNVEIDPATGRELWWKDMTPEEYNARVKADQDAADFIRELVGHSDDELRDWLASSAGQGGLIDTIRQVERDGADQTAEANDRPSTEWPE